MSDLDRFEQRLSAVERVVVDGDVAIDELTELATLEETVATLEERIEEHEQRLAELEAAIQSAEGYIDSVESVHDDVRQQAGAAVATTDRLERRLDKLEVELDDVQGGVLEPVTASGHDGDEAASGSALEFDSLEDEDQTEELDLESEKESGGIIDDEVDRPLSSANQDAVESAVGEGEDSSPQAEDNGDQGLLMSIRSRIS